MTVDPEFSREWVRAWAAEYPADHDDVLEPLRDKPQFDRDDMVVVVAWKFISMAHRKANASRYLAREPEARIQEIT